MEEKKDSRTLKEIRERKIALQEELRKLEETFESDIDTLQEEVSDRISPLWWINKYPLRIVGTAVLVGFLAGSQDKHSSVTGTTVLAAVVASLKTVVARKIVDQVVKIVEGEDNN